ncbi:MAG TPA: rod shape-determining protein MreC [Candidatus Omnitrophota bacterium]|nr:rod shape-determining protein MreC [Candidatus Omnitrophota bacterium]HPD84017.1 rod shape-determining protein MreC [Candidatus Omnitrophota bacterium]HRZ02874.1 rod shape-determining protein MreC [Candidatus Omnitrophota bacterium]
MSRKTKKLLIYCLILVFPLFFLFAKQAAFQSFKMNVVDISSLPIRVVLFPFEEIKKIVFYRSTFNKYTKLKREADILRTKFIKQEELIRENNRLKELLDLKWNSNYPGILARVIARDPSNWAAAVIIDKGETNGIKQGMPVINSAGVVGKISEVGRRTSKVLLLSDPNFSVPALIQRNREQGLVSGTLQGVCRMRYLSSGADVRAGDKVITSKLSTFFPEGLMIGDVISVREGLEGPTVECLIRPAVSPSQTEEVLVIIKGR